MARPACTVRVSSDARGSEPPVLSLTSLRLVARLRGKAADR